MNYTTLFYWLTVADNARTMFIVFIVVFTAISVISTICYFFNASDSEGTEEGQRLSRKWMWYSYPFMILFWSLYVFTPSKKDALLIVAGGTTLNFLANDKSAKEIPSELSHFVLTELKNMSKDASIDLNIKDQKNKLLEKAKKMSAEELMNEMKKDTTFAKIILNED